MPEFMRAYCERAAATAGKPGSPIRFVASTGGVARDGLIIDPTAWDLDAYKANPSVLWSHDYIGQRPPIGRSLDVWIENDRLMADVEFDQDDEFARSIEAKYRKGYLSAVSVGWDTKEMQPVENPNVAGRVTRAELLDISAVSIPGDPNALMQRQQRGLAVMAHDILTLVEPEPVPPESDATEAISNAVIDRLTAAAERSIAAPSPTDSEPDDSARASWDDTAAAMVRVFRPHAQRPDADRDAEYRRLCRAYQRHRKTPPEFVATDALDALAAEDIRGLFLEGEPELLPDLFAAMASRAGAVLSARNRGDLDKAIELIQGVLKRAQKEAETPPEPSDDERAMTALQAFAAAFAT